MVVVFSPVISDFKIAWCSFGLIFAATIVLIIGSWFYRAVRPDLRLSSALGCSAQIMAFSAVGAPLSYLAASAGFPLYDQAFDAADKALGFDWMTLLGWLNAHATLIVIFRAIYLSLTVQATLIVLSLAFAGQLAWLRIFVFAFICAAIVTIAMSCVLPAQGVWSYYDLGANHPSYAMPVSHASWPVFHGLRDGTYRQLVAEGAEGIITFPSLHAALAVILCVVAWPNRWLRWLIIPTNVVMLAATPIEGSPYIVDVIAGIAIAGLSVAAGVALWRYAASKSSPGERMAPSVATAAQ
jgi:PAP2 superfamily